MPIFEEGHIFVIPDSRTYKKLKNKEGRGSHLLATFLHSLNFKDKFNEIAEEC